MSAIPDIDDLWTCLPCSCGTYISIGKINSTCAVGMERVAVAMVETKAREPWGRTGLGVLFTPSVMASERCAVQPEGHLEDAHTSPQCK